MWSIISMRNKVIAGGIILLFTSCFLDKEYCEKVNKFTDEDDYQIILSEKPYNTSTNLVFHYVVKGKEVSTQRDTILKLYHYRWHDSFVFYWDKGDSIVKRKNTRVTEIHKKDTVYFMEWDCDTPLINGMTTDQVSQTGNFRMLKEKYYQEYR